MKELLALAPFVLMTACGLAKTTGKGEVTVSFDVTSTANTYQEDETVDPTTIKEVQDNVSSITGGKVKQIDVLVASNNTTATEGRVELRGSLTEGMFPTTPHVKIPGVDGEMVSLAANSRYSVAEGDALTAIQTLIFPAGGGVKPLYVRVDASADQPLQPKMVLDVIFSLEFDIDLL